MPLYTKAIHFKVEDLEQMSFSECDELLLCFRYLLNRDDHPLERNEIERNMEVLEKYIEHLKDAPSI